MNLKSILSQVHINTLTNVVMLNDTMEFNDVPLNDIIPLVNKHVTQKQAFVHMYTGLCDRIY